MDKTTITRLSCTYGNYVTNIHKLDTTKTYQLYPTGGADLNGRKYVALSKPPTEEEKKKYNLM
jgi:hypothetical protein